MDANESEAYVTLQIRIEPEAAALLDMLTSPYGKGRLISGLLENRRGAMAGY